MTGGGRSTAGLAATFLLINALYIPLVEEPLLERKLGDDNRQYKHHVRRWLPRWTAPTPPWPSNGGD